MSADLNRYVGKRRKEYIAARKKERVSEKGLETLHDMGMHIDGERRNTTVVNEANRMLASGEFETSKNVRNLVHFMNPLRWRALVRARRVGRGAKKRK